MEGIQPGAGVWAQTLSVDRQLAKAGEQAKRKYPRRVELWVGVGGRDGWSARLDTVESG